MTRSIPKIIDSEDIRVVVTYNILYNGKISI